MHEGGWYGHHKAGYHNWEKIYRCGLTPMIGEKLPSYRDNLIKRSLMFLCFKVFKARSQITKTPWYKQIHIFVLAIAICPSNIYNHLFLNEGKNCTSLPF